VRPWLGMKMLGLTEDIISQLKERDVSFPDVKTGVLVPQVPKNYNISRVF
jgi:HtrA serine peptidase 2